MQHGAARSAPDNFSLGITPLKPSAVPPLAVALRAYIGLGSNLDDPVAQLRRALRALATLPMTQLHAHSSLYRSAPLGGLDQPEYINAVAALDTRLTAADALDTRLTAADLLENLFAIERAQGRVRGGGARWQSRTLDLDLLLYGDQRIADATLTVPHPALSERAFVLYPLQEIAPVLNIPGLGDLGTLIARCPKTSLQRLEDVT